MKNELNQRISKYVLNHHYHHKVDISDCYIPEKSMKTTKACCKTMSRSHLHKKQKSTNLSRSLIFA